MGGSDTVEQPVQPTAQSYSSSISDYVNAYPQLFSLMQQYAPQEAQLNLDLLNQYGGQTLAAQKAAQEAAYPEQTAIRNTLMSQAQTGMNEQVPDYMRQQYRSDMNAALGNNAQSGIGADYMSRSMLDLQKGYNDYYRNLGLQLTSSQPTYTVQAPSYTNQLSQMTPNSALSYNQGLYNTQMGAYNNQYNTWANSSSSNLGGALGSVLGAGIGGAAAMMMPGSQAYLMPLGASIGGGLGSSF
jgi:hypothetical protein